MARLSHVALRVVDLRAAETYYADLFDLDVAFREAEVDGTWRSVPPDAGWREVERVGLDLDLVYLRRDGFDLALERADPGFGTGRLSHLGVSMEGPAFEAFRDRLDDHEGVVEAASDRSLVFTDRRDVTWEVTRGYTARSTGERTGAWLDL